MTVTIQVIIHIAVTLVAVVTMALRLEHRITKIETDVEWIKGRLNPGRKGVTKNGYDSKTNRT